MERPDIKMLILCYASYRTDGRDGVQDNQGVNHYQSFKYACSMFHGL